MIFCLISLDFCPFFHLFFVDDESRLQSPLCSIILQIYKNNSPNQISLLLIKANYLFFDLSQLHLVQMLP